MHFLGESALCKIIFYFFKFFGLATMSLKFAKNQERAVLARSILGILHNAAVGCLKISLYSVIVSRSLKSVVNEKLEYKKGIDAVCLTLGLLTAEFVLIYFCVKQQQAIEFASKVRSVQESLKIFDAKTVDYKNIEWTISREIFLVVVLNLVIIIFTATLANESIEHIYLVYLYWCDFITYCVFLQYSSVLNVIRSFLKILNAKFSQILIDNRDVRPACEASVCCTPDLRMSKFAQLRKLHAQVYELAEEVCNFYSLPMLLCMLYVLLSAAFTAYFLTSSLLYANVSTKIIVCCTLSMCCYCVPLVMLTKFADACILESENTGKLITKWMDDLNNQYIANQLNQFSNFLMHQRLRFTVVGLFSLNGSILISIAGSITTYMMILLQFQSYIY